MVNALDRQSFYQCLSTTLLAQGKLNQTDFLRIERLVKQMEQGDLPALIMKDQSGGDNLLDLLIRLGVCSDRDVATTVSEISGLPLLLREQYPLSPPLDDKVSVRFFREYKLAILDELEHELQVLVVDPTNTFAIEALAMAYDKPVSIQIGVLSEINELIEKLYDSDRSTMDKAIGALQSEWRVDEDIEHLKDLASEAPVIRIVNLIMQKALEYRASDIHIEPFEQRLIVRFRVDGVLQDIEAPPVTSAAAVTSRIKIMAKLNIAERRLPQDGRIKLQIQGKELDMRVSTLPTMYGESMVIRLLEKENLVLDFNAQGFSPHALQRFNASLDLPHGIILITGPTGSGKTTTLYTALNRLNTIQRKIITVEDPVEYQLEGINQVQVQSKIGLDFPAALRSIVRQDPDVIMIGEMRDRETASIAIQAALTGHLVLSTLHTNDAVGGIIRLRDMGLEDYLLTSTLNAILAQRLVRCLCKHCKRAYPADEALIKQLSLRRFQPEGEILLYEPVGCGHCAQLGYRGRSMIVELLVMSDSFEHLIITGADSLTLQMQAAKEGMITLYQDGLSKAIAGVTSLAEVVRVTSEN